MLCTSLKKRSFGLALAVAGGLIVAGTATETFAATINFATGQNSSGTIQTTGNAVDANWMVSGGSNAKVVAPGNADWCTAALCGHDWMANGPGSSWVAPNPNSSSNGNFTLSYSFNLTGVDLSTVSLTGGQFLFDDQGTIALNGHTLASSAFGDWQSFTSFFLPTSDLVAGNNTLTITLSNSDTFPQAARLQGMLTFGGGSGGTGGGTSGVPAPKSLPLMMAGLAGLLFLRRKRAAEAS